MNFLFVKFCQFRELGPMHSVLDPWFRDSVRVFRNAVKSCLYLTNERSTLIQVMKKNIYIHSKIPNISHTKSPNLIVSCLVLQLSLPNPMKPGVKLRMKM